MKPGNPIPRTLTWQRMQKLGEFTLRDLADCASRGFLQQYVQELEKASYLKKLNPNRAGRQITRYQLIYNTGAQAPIVASGEVVDPNKQKSPDKQTRCWQAMRVLKVFSQADLQTCAEIDEDFAYEYCAALIRAGFLTSNGGGRKGSEYRLVRNTGPLAPVLQLQKGQIYDPNINTTICSVRKNKKEIASA